MTEIPEHLMKRAQAAREKAALEGGDASTPEELALVNLGMPLHLARRAIAARLRAVSNEPAVSDPRIPAHLIERSRAAKARAGQNPTPESPTGLHNFAAFKEKLSRVIEERKGLFSERPVPQLVLESFETGLVIGAVKRRYDEPMDDVWQMTRDYRDVLPPQTNEQMDRFTRGKLVEGYRPVAESIEAGMVGMLRPWVELADRGITNAVPNHLDAAFFNQVRKGQGYIKTFKSAADGNLVVDIVRVSEGLVVEPDLAEAIGNFEGLLSADESSPEWDINHFEAKQPSFGVSRNTEIFDPRGFAAGARLVASLIK